MAHDLIDGRWSPVEPHRMIRAAAERRFVMFDNGYVCRLVRWPQPRGKGRARCATPHGTTFTARLARIVAVDWTTP